MRYGEVITEGPLRTKNAFIDRNQILRVGTRVQIPEIDYDERNPIVLPGISLKHDYENHLSYQIIADTHKKLMHGGISSTISTIKQAYFIPGIYAGVKNHIDNCQRCVIINAKTQKQIMGNFPKESIVRNPVFNDITIDYLGPISLKTKVAF